MQPNLIVVATPLEWDGLFHKQKLPPNWELLITGIGMVNTAYRLGACLAKTDYQRVWNLGIAGSFNLSWRLGSLVEVVSDSFPELGCRTQNAWLDLQALGFPLMFHEKPIYNILQNPNPPITDLQKAIGLTINTITGTDSQKNELLTRYQADIETMESAAVFLACCQANVPFTCIRAISNYVENRNTANWKIPDSLEALNQWFTKIVFSQ